MNKVNRDEEIFKELEILKGEYKKLETKKIETETKLKGLEDRLAELKKKAEEAYGTSDLDTLQKMLEDWRKENEEKIAAYRNHINQIKEELNDLEVTLGYERQ